MFMHFLRKMDHRKRLIKPSRYVTTLSDKAPRKKAVDGRGKPPIEEDIRKL